MYSYLIEGAVFQMNYRGRHFCILINLKAKACTPRSVVCTEFFISVQFNFTSVFFSLFKCYVMPILRFHLKCFSYFSYTYLFPQKMLAIKTFNLLWFHSNLSQWNRCATAPTRVMTSSPSSQRSWSSGCQKQGARHWGGWWGCIQRSWRYQSRETRRSHSSTSTGISGKLFVFEFIL